MNAIVTLNVFSGIPNPRWQLSTAQLIRFQELLVTIPIVVPGARFASHPFAVTRQPVGYDGALPRDVLQLDHVPHIDPLDPPGAPGAAGDDTDLLARPLSGFRGFRVDIQDNDNVAVVETFERLILETPTGQLRRDAAPVSFEEQLYATCPIDVRQQQLAGMTYAELQVSGDETLIDGLEGPDRHLRCDASPAYAGNVGSWKTHVLDNNCYNYATDTLAVPPAQPAVPGPAAQLLTRPLTDASLRAALQADQLENRGSRLPAMCPPRGGHYLVVLIREHPVSHLVRDFHCVRLDRTGTWSHKDGHGGIRNHDDAHHLMTDLTQARFKWTPRLVGVYLAHYSKRCLID